MSNGWSWWVIGLIVLNLGGTLFLFLWAPHAKVPVLPDGTTGHAWADGALREGLHRLPMWWLVMSFAMFLASFSYLVLYPGFGNFTGALGWTSAAEHDQAAAKSLSRLEPLMNRLSRMETTAIANDPQGRQLGARLFIDNCAACHGRTGSGNIQLGVPNLTDGDWLYGGSTEDIQTSIHDGRIGMMPAWKALGEATVHNLIEHVLALSGQPHEATAAAAGKETFAATCSACHGAEGKGNPLMGAPNLTDNIWLHGGSREAISKTIHEGHQGQMPAWSPRLSDQEIHVLVGYIHHLTQHNATVAH